jgi:hypothetical protein
MKVVDRQAENGEDIGSDQAGKKPLFGLVVRFDVREEITVTDRSNEKGQQPYHRVVNWAPALGISIGKHL